MVLPMAGKKTPVNIVFVCLVFIPRTIFDALYLYFDALYNEV